MAWFHRVARVGWATRRRVTFARAPVGREADAEGHGVRYKGERTEGEWTATVDPTTSWRPR